MIKNVPVNGTIPKGESVSYTSKAGNWEYVTFGIQVTGYGWFHSFHSQTQRQAVPADRHRQDYLRLAHHRIVVSPLRSESQPSGVLRPLHP